MNSLHIDFVNFSDTERLKSLKGSLMNALQQVITGVVLEGVEGIELRSDYRRVNMLYQGQRPDQETLLGAFEIALYSTRLQGHGEITAEQAPVSEDGTDHIVIRDMSTSAASKQSSIQDEPPVREAPRGIDWSALWGDLFGGPHR